MMAVIRKNVEMNILPKFGNSKDDDIVKFIQKLSLSLNIYDLMIKPKQGTFTCFVRMCLYLLSFAFKGHSGLSTTNKCTSCRIQLFRITISITIRASQRETELRLY